MAEHDYDLAVLARRDGMRRYANLRKLARLARSYEELRGADLEGFVRFVAGQEDVGAKESDAVSEEEGADAVRLLTIHAAKGLEFKVVVVADAGRSRPPVSDILALSDGRFGFKVAHPATGTRVGTESYRDVKEHRDRAEQAERLRLYYVAMTRAMERLIVSGSIGPAGDGSDETPIGWALTRLGPRRARRGRATPAGRSRSTAGRPRSSCASTADARSRRPSRRSASPPPSPSPSRASSRSSRARARRCRRRRRGCASSRPSPSRPVIGSRGSPTAPLSLFERCSYRYYAERVAGMKPAPWAAGDGEGDGGLHPTEVGDAVHRLLERVDLASPTVPESSRRPCAGGIRPSPTPSSTGSRSSCAATAPRRSPGGSRRSRARGSSGRSRSSSTASC